MNSKQTQNNIPYGWQLYQLKQIGEFKNGVNKSKEDFGHGAPFVNLMDIFGYSSIKNKRFDLVNVSDDELQKYNLKKGDILFVRSSVKPAGVGLATLIEEDLMKTVYSGFIIRFRSDESLIVHGFKKYAFQNSIFRNRLIATSSVSANTNINQEALNKLPVLLPSLVEQKRIVSVLEIWDKAIEALIKKIEIKKKIKKGLMQKLLTGKIRLSGFKNNWDTIKLGDVSDIKRGDSITKKNIAYGAVPVIAGGQQPAYYHNRSNRQGKTITISGSGAYAGYVDYYDMPIFVSDGMSIQENSLNILFIYYYLKLKQKHLYLLQTGGAQPHIYPKDIKRIELNIPICREEQDAIVNILITMDGELATLEKSRLLYQGQKKYLLNNLIIGAIRVPEFLQMKG